MKRWGDLSARQRQYVQRIIAGYKDIEPSDTKLTQEQANESLDAALEVLSKAITFDVSE